ncbi:MAG TPA: hypothetical protein DHW49_00560 [Anaerolineae bacterium]|nr:hypothetical protein [Flavobacterium sp.]HCK64730.1 hypothetical protein [Anaerolineae bacterium]
MNGLTGARVVIVDDEEKEAIPVIKELSKKGIPVVYFGNVNDLPNNGLIGVRLAILDMDLVGGGVPDKSKISTLIGYLKKIININNGPYGVLVWTKHIELQELFESQIFAAHDVPNPVFTICVAKADCKDRRGNFSLSKVSSQIGIALKSFSPLLLIQKWEETGFFSTTEVTNQLSNLSIKNSANLSEWREKWKTEFLQLLHAIAVAEAGRQLSDNKVLSSLYWAMNPLHSDRMENNVSKLSKSLSKHSTEITSLNPTNDISSKAKLNSMLHLAMTNVNDFFAGNIYMRSKFGKLIPTANKILDDIVENNNKKQTISILSPLSKVIAVEVNANCDHSQDKVRIARLLVGLVIPEDKINRIKRRASFLYELGPLFLETRTISAGVYYIYFSSLHLVTIELKQALKAIPLARLRGQAFSDMQAWFARQSTRPGMLALK